MKISVLTATYNRANLLHKLYESLVKNKNFGLDIEWLIMDDGSNDDTEQKVKEFIKQEQEKKQKQEENQEPETGEKKIQIKYFKQENSGKMVAINKLAQIASGELIIDCDSDDYFTENALKIVKEEFEKTKKNNLYAICFLKQDEKGNIDGNKFPNEISTMFDMYFKEKVTGEKVLVYYADVRKKYKHEIENHEKFITEARMYHKMDKNYKIKCINLPIEVGEYRKDGYTSNISKTFTTSPHGYFKYFEEILQNDFKGVTFDKRLYSIKHYILFSVITKNKIRFNNIKSILNRLLILLLFVPGKIKTKKMFLNG